MRPLDVLVYSGPGVSQSSLYQTLAMLRRILSSSHSVATISPPALSSHPWETNCALLVVPGGRDLPYISEIGSRGIQKIRNYIQQGGSYLGICAGAYFASSYIEFEQGTGLEVCGPRELALFEGSCIGSAFPGFVYDSEDGARDVKLALNIDALRQSYPRATTTPATLTAYHNGGGYFTNITQSTVLAKYSDLPDQPAAIIASSLGTGKAILCGTHPEHLSPIQSDHSGTTAQRIDLCKALLKSLNVESPERDSTPSRPSPQYFISSSAAKNQQFHQALLAKFKDPANGVFKDIKDAFKIVSKPTPSNAEDWKEEDPNEIIIADAPPTTPLFDLQLFYQELSSFQGQLRLRNGQIGSCMLYSECVTSTQTLLDKNPKLLSCIPSGTVSVASHQLSGRGRGGNSWISPPGCLQFSLVLRAPQSLASKLVFVQYLTALAIVESIGEMEGYQELKNRTRIKWPNDVYVDMGESGKAKVGGILVNTSWAGSEFTLVVGAGLNVLDTSPTTSLLDVINLINASTGSKLEPIRQERMLAAILAKLEDYWGLFVAHGGEFDAFLQPYLSAWLHSGSVITLEETGQKLEIIGLTTDYGLLKTREVLEDGRLGEVVELQPDGNSFDMLKGLIKQKT